MAAHTHFEQRGPASWARNEDSDSGERPEEGGTTANQSGSGGRGLRSTTRDYLCNLLPICTAYGPEVAYRARPPAATSLPTLENGNIWPAGLARHDKTASSEVPKGRISPIARDSEGSPSPNGHYKFSNRKGFSTRCKAWEIFSFCQSLPGRSPGDVHERHINRQSFDEFRYCGEQ